MSAIELTLAEQYRRSHCDRTGQEHHCIGTIRLSPGIMLLDCNLCGQSNEDLCESMQISDTAAIIAKLFGFEWRSLEPQRQRRILQELYMLVKGRP